MIDQRSYPVDPYLLFYKLEMAVLDSLLDKANMTDDFEYFSLIGRGGSCTPHTHTPERETAHHSPSQHRRVMSSKLKHSKEAVHRVRSDSSDTDQAGAIRSRTNSMPSSKNQLLRVRNFQTSGKRLENRGDTVKSSSHCSLASGSSGSSEHHSDTELDAAAEAASSSTHRILLMGAEGVGKTALTQQFLTSDDISVDDYLDDGQEKYCTVQVDGEESFLIFMDSDFDKNNYDPSSANAYIVCYSCTDKDSFVEAQALLKNLRHFEKSKAIILCGNKSDLARKRQVSTEEGKQLASEFGAKFTETSTMLNHKVDNLLVGILGQIKEQSRQTAKLQHKKSNKSSGGGFRKSVKGLVGKFVHRGSGKKGESSSP